MSEIAVLGLGRFGASIAMSLEEMGNEVLGVDSNMDIIDDIAPHLTSAVCMDLTDEKALHSLDLSDFDCVIVGIGTDNESSIFVTMMVKDMGVKRLVCKADNEVHARILEKVGADQVVFPERDSAIRLARTIANNRVLDFMQLSEESSVVEIIPQTDWVGKSLAELSFRNNYNVIVVAIRRGEDVMLPDADSLIQKDDVLILIGRDKDLNRLG